MCGKKNAHSFYHTHTLTYLTYPTYRPKSHSFLGVYVCVVCWCRARARLHTTTLTTLRGLKIYLLFNRLVRRFVMSVNVSGVSKVKL